MPDSPVSRTRDPKEDKILEAARAAFMELGYAATSMDVVAQRARASKTTLYTRFPSKEALFAACVTAETERQGLDFSPEQFRAVGLEEALTQIGRRFVELIFSPAAVRVNQMVTGEAGRFPELAAAFQRGGPDRVIGAVTDYLADAARRGLIEVEDPRTAAGIFLSLAKGMPHCHLLMGLCEPPSPPERDAHVRLAVKVFLDGVRRRPSAGGR